VSNFKSKKRFAFEERQITELLKSSAELEVEQPCGILPIDYFSVEAVPEVKPDYSDGRKLKPHPEADRPPQIKQISLFESRPNITRFTEYR
jgi:hypothetical protein